MHQCWLIAEFAIRIVDCVATDDKGGRSALHALATTCRALQEPALDFLWYKQNTLSHLIRCLPEDLWAVKDGIGFNELASDTDLLSRSALMVRLVFCRY